MTCTCCANSGCRAALSVLADHVPARVAAGAGRAGRAAGAGRAAARRGPDPGDRPGGPVADPRGGGARCCAPPGWCWARMTLAALHRRTEGWPAGLYLAALYLREGGSLPGAAASFGGDDRFVSEYVESEFLARISRRQRVFLTRTAVLERMSGPLCEAVLDLPGSGAALAELARSNLLLVPLDRRGPVVPLPSPVPRHAAGGAGTPGARPDPGAAAPRRRLVPATTTCPRRRWSTPWPPGTSTRSPAWWRRSALPAYRQGRITTLQRWFRWLDDRGGIEGHPLVAVWAAFLAAADGTAGRGRAVGRCG